MASSPRLPTEGLRNVRFKKTFRRCGFVICSVKLIIYKAADEAVTYHLLTLAHGRNLKKKNAS